MSDLIVNVAVPKPLRATFDYRLPDSLPRPRPGARLKVPFGSREIIGVCLGVSTEAATATPLKAVSAVLDADPALPADVLALVSWAAEYYKHPIGDALATALPGYLRAGRQLQDLYERWWRACPGETGQIPARATKQRAAFEALSRAGPQTQSALRAQGFDNRVLDALAARGLAESTDAPPAPPTATRDGGLELTAEQATAVDALNAAAGDFCAHLLEGVTGSGKTEVYLQVIANVLAAGRQALVLVPEISLTPQTLARFEARFAAVGAYHSALGDAERARAWDGCKSGRLAVLIGTRSAIFVPFKDLGFIAVDEEHDGSFKQQDGFHYSARDLAAKRASDLRIPVVFGSATPALETVHNAESGRYRHLRLTARTGAAAPPRMQVVDLRGQSLSEGLSRTLLSALKSQLGAGNQGLVFINRRGYAPSLVCTSCGERSDCPRCEIPFTVHRSPPTLRCHHCLAQAPIPNVCAACGFDGLRPIGFGTQRTEAALVSAFPDVPVLRIDRDTTRSPQALEHRLAHIRRGQPAILVGTQMLAKGHHFPRVTVVGVLNADAGFASADFRAPEHTAQLIEQVAGRAGRAERPGEVIIQSYDPDNPLLAALIADGYQGFARTELTHRRAAGLPPFRAMALLRAEAAEQAPALEHLRTLLEPIEALADVERWGPVPAPLARRANRFRTQAAVLARSRTVLGRALNLVLERAASIRRRNVRFSLDVDPFDMV